MSDVIRLDAATLGAKIAAKELSSVEVTQACLDQIAATDERYHAFSCTSPPRRPRRRRRRGREGGRR